MERAQKQAVQTRTPHFHMTTAQSFASPPFPSTSWLPFLDTCDLGGIRSLILGGRRSQLIHFSGAPSNAGVVGDYELLPLLGTVNYPGHALTHER